MVWEVTLVGGGIFLFLVLADSREEAEALAVAALPYRTFPLLATRRRDIEVWAKEFSTMVWDQAKKDSLCPF